MLFEYSMYCPAYLIHSIHSYIIILLLISTAVAMIHRLYLHMRGCTGEPLRYAFTTIKHSYILIDKKKI